MRSRKLQPRNIIILILALSISALQLISCKQQDKFSYTPPNGIASMHCVNQCASAKFACQQNCEKTIQNYALLNSIQKTMANEDKNFQPSYREQQGDCGCIANYNSCYQRCGGTVNDNTQSSK